MHFREVSIFGQPVIFLSVDIGSIVTAPGWTEVGVPNTLQVSRNAQCTRTADQQITSVLEVQYLQILIFLAFGITFQTLVGG